MASSQVPGVVYDGDRRSVHAGLRQSINPRLNVPHLQISGALRPARGPRLVGTAVAQVRLNSLRIGANLLPSHMHGIAYANCQGLSVPLDRYMGSSDLPACPCATASLSWLPLLEVPESRTTIQVSISLVPGTTSSVVVSGPAQSTRRSVLSSSRRLPKAGNARATRCRLCSPESIASGQRDLVSATGRTSLFVIGVIVPSDSSTFVPRPRRPWIIALVLHRIRKELSLSCNQTCHGHKKAKP